MSIVELSKLAGVSVATVSRVVNNSPVVAPATADAVRQAMRQLNYAGPRRRRPRSGVDALQHRAIALLFPDPSAEALKTVLSGRLSYGINQELARLHVSFVVTSLRDWDRMPACIENRSVDGVILRGTVPIEQFLPLIDPTPCVTVFEAIRRPSRGDQVLDDSGLIGEIAATRLIEQGARRLCCVSRDPLHPAYSARADAFVRTARFAGLEARTVAAAVPYRELARAVWADGDERPDGVFIAGHDNDLVGVYSELTAVGVRVGSDLRLIATAYDPARVAALDPRLDYIDIDPEEIGRQAVRVLMERLEHPDAPFQRRLVSPRLVKAVAGGGL